MNRAIPCSLIRGGSSRGAYFLADALPADPEARDALLARIMGGPDPLQVDGIGGGHPLTSKVAVVSRSADSRADVDYLFLQVDPTRQTVSSAQNCGNLLAGVGVFALQEGLVAAGDPRSTIRVRMLNSDALCHLELCTPGGIYEPDGDTAIDGVPGTGSAIVCNYLDIAGSACGALRPTGRVIDRVGDVEVTAVDNGMPVVLLRAADLGVEGCESPEQLDANDALRAQLEAIRLEMGPRMQLGDVRDASVPKMCLISPAEDALLTTRTFIPHLCHKSIGVLGAVSVATAALWSGSVAEGMAKVPNGDRKRCHLAHPSGSLEVQLEVGEDGEVCSAGVVRTARALFRGEVMA